MDLTLNSRQERIIHIIMVSICTRGETLREHAYIYGDRNNKQAMQRQVGACLVHYPITVDAVTVSRLCSVVHFFKN